jgi:hypothetical protein
MISWLIKELSHSDMSIQLLILPWFNKKMPV